MNKILSENKTNIMYSLSELKSSSDLKIESETKFYKNLSDEHTEEIIDEIISFDIIDEMYHRGYVPKIYNGCHGGFGWSYGATVLLDIIGETTKFTNEEQDNRINEEIIEAKIINYMNSINHTVGSKYRQLPTFGFVKKDLYEFISIIEYDGLEELKFNPDSWFKYMIKKIIDSGISNNEKVMQINSCIHMKQTDIIIYPSDCNCIIQTPLSKQRGRQTLTKVDEKDNCEAKKQKLNESALVLLPTGEKDAKSKSDQSSESNSEPDTKAEDQNITSKSESDPEESDEAEEGKEEAAILKMYYKYDFEDVLDTAYGEQEELKDYLIAEILRYRYRDDDTEDEITEDYLNTLSCADVIRMAIHEGTGRTALMWALLNNLPDSENRSKQRGYGVTAIIIGETMACA